MDRTDLVEFNNKCLTLGKDSWILKLNTNQNQTKNKVSFNFLLINKFNQFRLPNLEGYLKSQTSKYMLKIYNIIFKYYFVNGAVKKKF